MACGKSFKSSASRRARSSKRVAVGAADAFAQGDGSFEKRDGAAAFARLHERPREARRGSGVVRSVAKRPLEELARVGDVAVVEQRARRSVARVVASPRAGVLRLVVLGVGERALHVARVEPSDGVCAQRGSARPGARATAMSSAARRSAAVFSSAASRQYASAAKRRERLVTHGFANRFARAAEIADARRATPHPRARRDAPAGFRRASRAPLRRDLRRPRRSRRPSSRARDVAARARARATYSARAASTSPAASSWSPVTTSSASSTSRLASAPSAGGTISASSSTSARSDSNAEVRPAHAARARRTRPDRGQDRLAELRPGIREHDEATRDARPRRRAWRRSRAARDRARVRRARRPARGSRRAARHPPTAPTTGRTRAPALVPAMPTSDARRSTPHHHATGVGHDVLHPRQHELRQPIEGERQRKVLEVTASMPKARDAARQIDRKFQVREQQREALDREGAELERLVELETERSARNREAQRYPIVVATSSVRGLGNALERLGFEGGARGRASRTQPQETTRPARPEPSVGVARCRRARSATADLIDALARTSCGRVVVCVRHRQRNTAPFPVPLSNGQREAVFVGDALHHREPDSRTVRARREERVEQASPRLGRRCRHRDRSPQAPASSPAAAHEHDHDAIPGARRLHAVAHQIPDELAELRAVRATTAPSRDPRT